MAELSHNIKDHIKSLSESVGHDYGATLNHENNYDASIVNHNVFGKFFIIDIKGEKNFVVPSMYVRSTVFYFLEDGTRRFIRQLYRSGSCVSHRGFSSVLKWMFKNSVSSNGCTQHKIKDSHFYTFCNIILDKHFNPLVIPCYDVEVLEDGNWSVKSIIYKISNSVYSNNSNGNDVAKKFITTKMVPYLAELGIMPICHTSATSIAYQSDLPIKIEIENLDKFVCNPIEPSPNFQEEANAILDALVEDILNTNE